MGKGVRNGERKMHMIFTVSRPCCQNILTLTLLLHGNSVPGLDLDIHSRHILLARLRTRERKEKKNITS